MSDLISRSRAIKEVSEWATDILHPNNLIKEDAIGILESLPSAEPKIKCIAQIRTDIDQQDAIIRKAVAKLTMGCTGCVHYDQQQTALICHECKRYYSDMYEDGE